MRTKWTQWPLFGAPNTKRWTIDNVALIGDAAHAMLPFAAQGAVMAIEDAWVLAQKMAASDDVNAAMAAYESERKPRVNRVMQLARTNAGIYHMKQPMAFFRDTTLKLMPASRLLARQDWIYGWRG